MTRTATFSGTILIVAGFVATAIAPEPESAEGGERFRDSVAGIDGGFTADQLRELTNDTTGKVTEKDGVITIDIVTRPRTL